MQFPVADFKALYPSFRRTRTATLELVAKNALAYVPKGCKSLFNQLWLLATAHLMQLRQDAKDGNGKTGAVASASIGSTSVSFATAHAGTSQQAWFNTTPYGLEFLALRAKCKSPVKYIGGTGRARPWL